MNYEQAMNYIKDTAKFGSNYGLERTEKILELLGDPHKKIKCIHIAGTNGKGSTTAMLTNILLAEGYKVGMYTSPYLEEFEERIQINNRNIPKESLSSIIEKVSKAVERVIALGYDHPTEFEIITCAMFLYFYEEAVDYAVVEVGLGGRLDSTNVIVPMVSVIASISYDHMNILGNTLKEIAYEKAGIIKNNVPVVIYPQGPEAMQVLESISEVKRSPLVLVKEDAGRLLEILDNSQRIEISTSNKKYNINLALLGKHQILNCAVVINIVETLQTMGVQISQEAVLKGLAAVKWKGRLEVLKKNPTVVIDGAHNLDGIRKLVDSIKTYFKYENMYLIIGVLGDKQVEEMLNCIVPLSKKVFALTPHSERAELSNLLKKKIIKINGNCEAYNDYYEAYSAAREISGEKDLIVISGSLYMIGDMRKIIKNAE